MNTKAKKKIVKIPISEKFLEVSEPFYKKVLTRRRQGGRIRV